MTLISILLKASILLLAAVLTNTLFGRRMSAAVRHLIWTLVVAGLLLLPVLSCLLPPWTAFTTPPIRTFAPAAIGQPRSSSQRETTGIRESSNFNASLEQSNPPAIPASIPWPGVLAAVYVMGAFVLLVRLVVERVLVQRRVRRWTEVTGPEWKDLLQECTARMDVRRTIRLLRSREENMPMALGIWHGVIVIPAIADTWSEDRRRAVLLHETSHLIRHDCLSQMLAAVACALYWVHPGAWWVARRLRIERELACDDRVLSVGANAREYAGHLLELAYALRSGRTAALAVSMAGPGQLEGRMLALLDAARNRAVPALRSHLAGLAILIVLLVPLAAVTISGRQVTDNAGAGSRSLISSPITFRAVQIPAADAPGTWEIQPTDRARIVHLQLREGSSSYSTTVDLDHVNGLSGEIPTGGGPVQFSVRRDAGTFTVEGVVRSGVGAGTFTFTPSTTFPTELARRGLDRPTPGEQRVLAGADIGFAFLDELAAQRYARPAHVAELVRAAQHGVSLSYLRGMGQLGQHAGNLDTLIDLANHGVSPEFIRDLANAGLSGLSTDDLRRARSSGVDGDYVRDLASLGYPKLSLDTLIQLRHHGVDPDYVRDLAAAGYPKLPIDTLIQLRNHGVDPDYVRDLGALGYQKLSLDTLIQLRNHGVDPDYARELSRLGYQKLPLDTLIELRSHGIDAEYVRDLQSLGYTGLKIEDFERMRSAGVSVDQVRSANARAGKRLSVDNLVSMAAKGWR
jgi:beta-lactamase regulating signal transducer with metallopeptidase domain